MQIFFGGAANENYASFSGIKTDAQKFYKGDISDD